MAGPEDNASTPFPQAPAPPRRATSYHSSQPSNSRARSASTSTKGPTVQVSVVPSNRDHSSSISSVESATLSNIIKQDANPYASHFSGFAGQNPKGKIKLMDDIDVEKQLIISAGGKREDVLSFVLKLMFLMVIVLGSGILIFYAL